VTNLSIVDEPALTDLGGLAQLGALDVLRIEGVGARSLDELASLTRAGSILIEGNAALEQIDRLQGVSFDELSVSYDTALTHLPAFVAPQSLQRVYVRGNPALQNGPELPNLASVESLTVRDNAALTRLDGFGALLSARSIEVSNNPRLEALGLGALERARTLRIVCNPALLESSLEPLRDIGGSVIIQGNMGSAAPCDAQ
jgi:hypothetical protein